jgi:tRNA threonylcarbamoyladenosine biosynthesis protein TsaE
MKIAAKLAEKIIRRRRSSSGAVVVALFGDLGSGKTVFAKGFAKKAGVKNHVTSPTFVILKKFDLKNKTFKNILHIDAYRILKPEEMFVLGWKKAVKNPENIILVEWPENIKKILPKSLFNVVLSHIKGGLRAIDISVVK